MSKAGISPNSVVPESGIHTPPASPTKIEVSSENKQIKITSTSTNAPLEEKVVKTVLDTPTQTVIETTVETTYEEPVSTAKKQTVTPSNAGATKEGHKSDNHHLLPIQLISEEKNYNQATLDFLKGTIANKSNIDQDNYHFISVFGSQSSGKSTLLNHLFHTNFDTMDAQVKRQQTTKGIWLGHAQQISTTQGISAPSAKDIFVLDVEGSDGAERGEDQEFERKAALFALAVSEVLIINMWEHQVGLYQGNNMELLKTVFEVNLSLFGKNKTQGHKILLLFVIRDHIGVTPIESLKASLLTELEKMWSSLSKPQGSEQSSIFDYFDFEFRGIGHKYLQYEQFVKDINLLGDAFTSETPSKSFFKKEYQHNLPLDGWNLYSENCWMTIENSVELDLPTQQILVAKFKTKEFSDAALETFQSEFGSYDSEGKDFETIAKHISALKKDALNSYDGYAIRYNKQVYEDERKNLSDNIYKVFFKFFTKISNELGPQLIKKFKDSLNTDKKSKSFVERSALAKKSVLDLFDIDLSVFTKHELLSESDKDLLVKTFEEKLMSEISNERSKEFANLVKRFEKNMKLKLHESLELLIIEPETSFWASYNTKFNQIFNELMESKFKSVETKAVDFKLGFDDKENNLKYNNFKVKSWCIWKDVINDDLTVNKLPSILEETFKKKFLFDDNDSPRFFTNVANIDEFSKTAKEYSMSMLDVYAVAKQNGEKIIPDIELPQDDEDENDDFSVKRDFGDILTNTEKEKIRIEFNKKIQLVILQTKRSVLSSQTKIPPYMFLLLGVLGFNEFMMILRHPLLLTICILSITGWYFIHRTGSYKAVQHIAVSSLQSVKDAAFEKLKDTLKDNKSSEQESESFEMEDLKVNKQD